MRLTRFNTGKKMEVRRRTAETVRQTFEGDADAFSSTAASEDAEKPSSYKEDRSLVSSLLEKGEALMSLAKGSDFHEVDSLVQSLKFFVEAAAKGSKEASDKVKQFVDTHRSEVIQRLPDELQEIVHVLADGSKEEKEAFRVANEIFDVMAGPEPGSTIPKDKLNDAAQKLMMLKEVELVGAGAAKSAHDFRGSVSKLLFIALVRSEDGLVVSTRLPYKKLKASACL